MPRLFFGLEIPAPIKANLLKVRTGIEGAHWQNETQLHLTLAFLGEVKERQVILARNNAREIVYPPFEVEAAGLGCFGKAESPNIMWAGITPETELKELQHSLSQRLTVSGFALHNPSFKPHITLSRFRDGAGSVVHLLDRHQNTRFGKWSVQEFVLFESTPSQAGSVYTVLERYPLIS